jgi:hypothetical protein
MHRQALGLQETVLGKEHPSTLTSMNNLATVLSDQNKYEQAEEMHRQSTWAEGHGTRQRASVHTDEHKQSGNSAEGSGQLQAGRRDASTRTRAV